MVVMMSLGALCHAAQSPIVISFEIVEFDCTALPEVFDEYKKALLQGPIFDLNTLERSVPKKSLVSHTQAIMPETTIEQTTAINESTFELELSAGKPDKGFSTLEIKFSFSKNKTSTTSGKTTVLLKLGDKPVMIGGVTQEDTTGSVGTNTKHKRITAILLQAKKG